MGKPTKIVLEDHIQKTAKGKIKFIKTNVPGSTPLGAIYGRWLSSYYSYGSREYRTSSSRHLVGEDGLTSLKEQGVIVVSDLEGWTKDQLVKLNGISHVTADRLIAVGRAANVSVRGTGWPWELKITVPIPDKMIPTVLQVDAEDVEKAITHQMKELVENFADNIEEKIIQAKIAELEEEQAELRREKEIMLERLNADTQKKARDIQRKRESLTARLDEE
ncbi:MAG: hypothetical protein ACXABY_08750 [Candidatus Thorarchaeota archaeon]|jgi:hypothetical protein